MNEWTDRNPFSALAIVVIILSLAAFIGYRLATGQAITEGFVVPERFRDDVLALDRRALDDAYTLQAQHLFRTWITDRIHDPSGIDKGLANARRGYVVARERLEKRQGQK